MLPKVIRSIIERFHNYEITPPSVVGAVIGCIIVVFVVPLSTYWQFPLGIILSLALIFVVDSAFAKAADFRIVAVMAMFATAILTAIMFFGVIRSDLHSTKIAAVQNGAALTRLGLHFTTGPGGLGSILVVPAGDKSRVKVVPCPAWAGSVNICIDVPSALSGNP